MLTFRIACLCVACLCVACLRGIRIVAVLLAVFSLFHPIAGHADNPYALQSPEEAIQHQLTCSEGTPCDQFAIPSGKDSVCYSGTCRSNACVGSPRSVLFQDALTKVNDCAESPAQCVGGSIQPISPDSSNWKPINTGQSCTGATPDGNLCTAPQCVGIECLEVKVADNTSCGTTQVDPCKTTTFLCSNGTCQAQVLFDTTSKACSLSTARTGPCDPAPNCDGAGTCVQGATRSLCCGNGIVEAAAGEQCEGASASCVNCKCVAQACPSGQTWNTTSCSCVVIPTPTSTPTPTATPDPRLLSVTVSASSPYQLRTSGYQFAVQSTFNASATADLTNSSNRPNFGVGPACNLDNLKISWSSRSATTCYLQSSPVDPNANNVRVGTSGTLNVGLLSASRQYAVQCYNSLNQTVTAAVVIMLSRPSEWATNNRYEMSAALGVPSPNDSIGILAQDKTNPANTPNMIYTNLMRACTNLGYDTYDGGRLGIVYGGFSSPSNNTVCWVVRPSPSSGSDIACQNALEAGDPDYVGSFYCVCSP